MVSDISRVRTYVPRRPHEVPSSYPQQPLRIFEDPALIRRLDTETLFFQFFYQQGTFQQLSVTEQSSYFLDVVYARVHTLTEGTHPHAVCSSVFSGPSLLFLRCSPSPILLCVIRTNRHNEGMCVHLTCLKKSTVVVLRI